MSIQVFDPPRLTPETATDAIGRAVEIAHSAVIAMVINVSPRGRAVLIRSWAKKGGYQWVGASSLVRREDCDRLPEPEWLQRARVSRRPPLVLFRVLNPTIGEAIDDIDDAPPAGLDPVTYRTFELSVRERRA
jgi:hypothetical protein